MHILITKKYLTYRNNKVKCAVGKRGIGKKRREGDLITPKGTFKIKRIFFRKDRVKNIKTKFEKIAINKKMGWCDDPYSKKYNKLIKYPFGYSSEKLYRSDNTYDILLVLDYNIDPIKKNKGSAIFIHIAKNNYSPTKGCIAVKKGDLLNLLKKISFKTKVKIR